MTSNIGDDSIWDQVWTELISATTTPGHQFNTPTVGNTGADGHPRLRTLVLRHCDHDRYELHFYTDRRSLKTVGLAGESWFSWLFWDSETQLQFSCGGNSHWLEAKLADQLFNELKKHSRKAYATVDGPSTEMTEAGGGLPADWEERSLEQTDYARANFGVVVTVVTAAEVLKLDRAGNRRLRGVKENGDWTLAWITP